MRLLLLTLCVVALPIAVPESHGQQQCVNGVCRQYMPSQPVAKRAVYYRKKMHAVVDGENKQVTVLVPKDMHKYKLLEIATEK